MSGDVSGERRGQRRLKIAIDAEIKLLVPHETFSPFPIHGITIDLSVGGMCVRTEEITKKLYGEVLRGMSHAKVTLRHSWLVAPLHVSGKVVWSEFHDPRPGQPSHCLLGIALHSMDAEEGRAFAAALDGIADRLTASRIDVPKPF
ncbi:MAG: PilZ domain-containing protein [Candidatus Sumerlaeia bacterium]|nr:PilZ domain-containing protein [Candidatus Sumerlaeia bacterium]